MRTKAEQKLRFLFYGKRYVIRVLQTLNLALTFLNNNDKVNIEM